MCGIAGILNFSRDMREKEEHYRTIMNAMGESIRHRGPDEEGVALLGHAGFAHRRLAVIDVEKGKQPMIREKDGYTFAICYNGELYNTGELRQDLLQKGYEFSTHSDTEVLLQLYIEYGLQAAKMLNGIYAFAIYDERNRSVYLCRDRFGIKPLFYSAAGEEMVFGSEIKALFCHPQIRPKVSRYGLCEIFGLGPARSPGVGVYEGIHEIPPGYHAVVDAAGMKLSPYFQLTAEAHRASYAETVLDVRELLFDAIERQLVSDVPICTLLSGGLDSSVVSAVAASYLQKQGRVLDTYSFDYVDNHENFKASSFQPEEDRPYVDLMIQSIGSHHRYLENDYRELYDYLFEAVVAKDLPGMVDVDSSLLGFARKIKKHHTVCLSGECADEIFGGYPWFRAPESYTQAAFPWSRDFSLRLEVLRPELRNKLPLEDYARSQYQKTMERVDFHGRETKTERRQKEISLLNTTWFMATLLERKDRMTMASGLEVRVPFADHRLIQYLYNVPWEYKYHEEDVKRLLKDAAGEILPKEVLYRKKCPYPKTYDPKYEGLLKESLTAILNQPQEPVNELVDKDRLLGWMSKPSDYGRPWFGQLMALPQMYAYIIEINYWLKKYEVALAL